MESILSELVKKIDALGEDNKRDRAARDGVGRPRLESEVRQLDGIRSRRQHSAFDLRHFASEDGKSSIFE